MAPLDIRDDVVEYSGQDQLIRALSDFAARVHEARYASQLPAAGPTDKLAKLNLGDPAAESEEPLLKNYFLELEEFRQVLEGALRMLLLAGRGRVKLPFFTKSETD